METVTQSDLKEIKEILTQVQVNQIKTEENLASQIQVVGKKATSLDKRLEVTEEKLSGQIQALGEKVSGLDKRLEVIETRVNSLTGWLDSGSSVCLGWWTPWAFR